MQRREIWLCIQDKNIVLSIDNNIKIGVDITVDDGNEITIEQLGYKEYFTDNLPLEQLNAVNKFLVILESVKLIL